MFDKFGEYIRTKHSEDIFYFSPEYMGYVDVFDIFRFLGMITKVNKLL